MNEDRAFVMRKAFEEAFGVLGQSTLQSMVHELKTQARVDLSDQSLTLVRLCDGLVSLYGEETAGVMIEELFLKMDQIAAEQKGGQS